MFVEAIQEILQDRCTGAVVRAIETHGPGSAAADLWSSLEDAGFMELLRPEGEGGAGLAMPELFPVLVQFGRHASPLPFAQGICARAVLALAVELPPGILTIASALESRPDGSLRCARVPYGAVARQVLAERDGQLLLLDARMAAVAARPDQSASMVWHDGGQAIPLDGDGAALQPMAAALHAALITGAMTRVFEMSLKYCNDRSQFGRPLSKFQAVQHQLSLMAEHIAASSVAAEMAFETQGRTPTLLRAALAKARTSEAVPIVADTAHALHGAIGITEEYDLQLYTRRLHAWRMAHGAEPRWHAVVGAAAAAGTAGLSAFVRTI